MPEMKTAMGNPWATFITALETNGVTFEQVQGASDRPRVIHATGVTDPISVAIIETEWRRRNTAVRGEETHRGGNGSAVGHGEGMGPSPEVAAAPRGAAVSPAAPMLALADVSRLASLPEELQDTVVAAEVLSAAVGCGGALIQLTSEGFLASSYVPLPMRSLCQTVLPVADAFLALRKVEEAEYRGKSLVAMALGEVVSEICTSYAHQIAKLQRWSQTKTMPLMGVVSEILRIGHHVVRLRHILPVDLLGTTGAESGIPGPRLLDHLCEQSGKLAGSREDDEMLLLLLRRALTPYLKMLHRWMHEGVLEDPFAEFFISETFEPSRPAPTAALNTQRRNISTLFPEGTAGGDVYGPDAMQQDVTAFERRFSINKLMIPTFLERPSRVAKMIFFAGKYCCLLREYNESVPTFGGAAEHMLTWTSTEALHRSIQTSFEIVSGAVIQLLFSPSVDLLGHLTSLKAYYLQERGDWVTDFLDSADELLVKSSDKVKAHSIRVLLQASIARSCGTDAYHDLIGCSFSDSTLEECVQRARMPLESKGLPPGRLSVQRVETRRCIELFQLEVDLQWPLTLILDAGVLRRFNVIFRLLTWLKVCERNLCGLWYNNEVLAQFNVAYGIKHQFIQFLRQFQFYVAHFVIEPQWSRLMSRIAQADSVFTITQALQDFFEGVELGLVLSSTHRFRSLVKILDLTARFCEIGRHHSTSTSPLIEATLHSVEDNFLRALSELASPIGQDYPQLVPLLTWIDFGGFYHRNNIYYVQHGAAVVP